MKAKQLLFGAMMAIVLASCSGKESLIKDYEKACNKGDAIKAAQIVSKLDSKYKEEDFTEKEMERIVNASAVLEEKAIDGMSDMLDLFE